MRINGSIKRAGLTSSQQILWKRKASPTHLTLITWRWMDATAVSLPLQTSACPGEWWDWGVLWSLEAVHLGFLRLRKSEMENQQHLPAEFCPGCLSRWITASQLSKTRFHGHICPSLLMLDMSAMPKRKEKQLPLCRHCEDRKSPFRT